MTGAASGLGLAICRELAASGWTIGMTDIQPDALSLATDEVSRLGGRPIAFVFDVSDKDAYRQVSDEFIGQLGGIDLLINNAGVGDGGLVEEYGLENWDWLLGINLNGVIYGSALFIPMMKTQGHGVIVNVSSAAAFTSLPRMGAYNVSKAAVLSLSETMSAELHAHGVQVSVVMPTFFRTAVMQFARGTAEELETSRLIFGTSSLGPEEVAAKVLYAAGKGRFHIILPFQAWLMYRLKRYFPKLMLYFFRKGETRRGMFRNMLSARFRKMERRGEVDHVYLDSVFGNDDSGRS